MAKMASSPPHFWNGMSAWLEDPCCSGHTLQGRQHRIPSSRQRSRRRGEEAVESNRRAGPHACARLRRPGRAGTAPRPRPTLAQALEEASYDPPSSGALEPAADARAALEEASYDPPSSSALEPAGAAPVPALPPPAPCPCLPSVPRPAIEEGEMFNLGVDRFTQPYQQHSPAKTTPLFGVNIHLYLDWEPVLGVWPLCI